MREGSIRLWGLCSEQLEKMDLPLTQTGKTVVTADINRNTDPSCKVTGRKATCMDNGFDIWVDEA